MSNNVQLAEFESLVKTVDPNALLRYYLFPTRIRIDCYNVKEIQILADTIHFDGISIEVREFAPALPKCILPRARNTGESSLNKDFQVELAAHLRAIDKRVIINFGQMDFTVHTVEMADIYHFFKSFEDEWMALGVKWGIIPRGSKPPKVDILILPDGQICIHAAGREPCKFLPGRINAAISFANYLYRHPEVMPPL